MVALLRFALENSALLLVPCGGAILLFFALRMKQRYLKEGVLLRRSRPIVDVWPAMRFDVELALHKLHQLEMADDSPGAAYWHDVAEILERWAGTRTQMERLREELERRLALLPKAK